MFLSDGRRSHKRPPNSGSAWRRTQRKILALYGPYLTHTIQDAFKVHCTGHHVVTLLGSATGSDNAEIKMRFDSGCRRLVGSFACSSLEKLHAGLHRAGRL